MLPAWRRYAPSVNLDVAHGARELAAHLADSGHTRAAYIDSVTGTATFDVRRDAFLGRGEVARDLGAARVHHRAPPSTSGRQPRPSPRAWPQWQRAGVTAVVCGTDTHAYGVLQEARVAGVRIPEELAVAGFDDLPYSATSNPGLTSVHLPATPLGLKAGEQLRGLMEGRPLEQPQLTLESSLVVRGSTA